MTARTDRAQRRPARMGHDHRRIMTGLAAGMVLLALVGVIFTFAALAVVSGGRAYVHGEGRWSKAQQQAVFYLDRYAESGDRTDLVRARDALSIPLGDRQARLALEGDAYDYPRAYEGLRQGGNHPADIPEMIWLFEHFELAPYFRQAIQLWAQGDQYITRLQQLAAALERQWASAEPSARELARLRTELGSVDRQLRELENRFSSTLNDGLRLLETALAIAGALVLLLLAGIGLLIFRWATRRIRSSEQRFWASFAHAPVGFALLSDRARCVEVNESLCNLVGLEREQLIGQSLDAIIEPLDDETVQQLLQWASEGRRRFERRLRCADGSRLWGELGLRPLPGSPHEAFIAVVEDISEEKQRTEHLSWQATHDALTGLYNRTHFETMLEEAIEDSRSGRAQHVLGFIDLDHFKQVNDTSGHAAGDALLGELAGLMRQELRTSDVLARIGGDEFGFLLHDCPKHVGRVIADELARAIAGFTFESHGQEFILSASIGIAELDGTFADVEAALRAVDTACYAAKGEGRNQVCVHGDATPPTSSSASASG